MIRQIFAEMSDTQLAKAAFIQITAKDTLADVNRDLKALEVQGFRLSLIHILCANIGASMISCRWAPATAR